MGRGKAPGAIHTQLLEGRRRRHTEADKAVEEQALMETLMHVHRVVGRNGADPLESFAGLYGVASHTDPQTGRPVCSDADVERTLNELAVLEDRGLVRLHFDERMAVNPEIHLTGLGLRELIARGYVFDRSGA